MADNVSVTAGSGTTIAADEVVDGTLGTVKVQFVKLMDGTLDGTNKAAVGANGLKVDGSGVTQPVSGTVTANAGSGTMAVSAASLPLPTGAAQDSTLTGGTQKTKLIDTGGTNVASVSAGGALKVDNSAVTQPVSGTVTANIGTSGSLALDATLTGGTQKTKIVDSGGTNVATVSAAGAVKVDGSAVTQPVSGTVTTSPPSNASTNVAQFGGTNVSTGTGAGGAGIPRVTVSNDSNVLATQSGTWTVQPGNTQNTTPWLVVDAPQTTGGYTTFHLVSAATTNATNIKASAGQVFGWYIYNSNAAARKIAFHNSASAPTAGASVFFSIVIPPGAGANVEFENGIAFSSGIGITTVTGLADSDATAVAANDLIINIFYK